MEINTSKMEEKEKEEEDHEIWNDIEEENRQKSNAIPVLHSSVGGRSECTHSNANLNVAQWSKKEGIRPDNHPNEERNQKQVIQHNSFSRIQNSIHNSSKSQIQKQYDDNDNILVDGVHQKDLFSSFKKEEELSGRSIQKRYGKEEEISSEGKDFNRKNPFDYSHTSSSSYSSPHNEERQQSRGENNNMGRQEPTKHNKVDKNVSSYCASIPLSTKSNHFRNSSLPSTLKSQNDRRDLGNKTKNQ